MSDDEDNPTFDDEDIIGPKCPISRGERKARKMLSKINGKHIENVSRVVFRQNDGSLFVIDNPKVYKHSSNNNNTFIVFGEVFDAKANLQQIQTEAAAVGINKRIEVKKDLETPVPNDDEHEDEDGDECTDIDESGLKSLDIELVMSQAKVSRRRAIAALRENDNDLVNTIIKLT